MDLIENYLKMSMVLTYWLEITRALVINFYRQAALALKIKIISLIKIRSEKKIISNNSKIKARISEIMNLCLTVMG